MSKEIFITQSDKDKLLEIIDKDYSYNNYGTSLNLKVLETEIRRANVISNIKLPDNVITMNTRVVLLIDDVEEELTLVFPDETDIKENKISVLSPIGTAILGYREGSSLEWNVPNGTVQIKVISVTHLPKKNH